MLNAMSYMGCECRLPFFFCIYSSKGSADYLWRIQAVIKKKIFLRSLSQRWRVTMQICTSTALEDSFDACVFYFSPFQLLSVDSCSWYRLSSCYMQCLVKHFHQMKNVFSSKLENCVFVFTLILSPPLTFILCPLRLETRRLNYQTVSC